MPKRVHGRGDHGPERHQTFGPYPGLALDAIGDGRWPVSVAIVVERSPRLGLSAICNIAALTIRGALIRSAAGMFTRHSRSS
jgi:hypothetical protein